MSRHVRTFGGRSRQQGLLDERLRFETLLSRLSATFIHLPADQIDGQIERGLQQIVEFLGVERSGLGQFSADGRELIVTHSYSAPGFSRIKRLDLAARLPWYTEMIRRGEVLRFTRLPDELPPEAVHEREWCRRDNLRAHLMIPFKVGDAILGGLGFGSIRRERDWPDDLVQSLQLVGEIFANALARKRADLALHESEARFRLMADTAPVMVWMSGPDKGCTYFNKSWLDFSGRPVESQLGSGWCEGVHPDDLRRCLDTYVRAFDARQGFRMEYRLLRSDGEYRWVLDAGTPRFEPDGTFEGYVGSCIDITDQKRVEEALREREARLRFLLESTHAIPWVADVQSMRFTYVGPQAAALLGYPGEAWLGQDFWADHIHPDDREAAIGYCWEHSRTHSDYEFDYRMVAADGRVVWIHDVVNVVAEDGAPRTLRGFMIDVTARRHAEEESRTLREQLARVGRVTAMGEMAASIAHEVNQPLCAIVSNAQALRHMVAGGGFDHGEVGETLRDVIKDGQRASAVLARIRDFLRKAPVERAVVGVNDLIREVTALTRHEMARRGVAVTLDLAAELPPVLGDRVQLQQVLLNLITNGADALERTPKKRRQLVVRSAEEAGGGVAVAVRDSGPGLDPADLARVFDAFFTTKPGSLGMGLAICKSIVEAHGGRIGARPNDGPGTTFQFTLPGLRSPSRGRPGDGREGSS
jgi:PAS domain S-box-containing protein